MKSTRCDSRRESLSREVQMHRLQQAIGEELTELQRYTLCAYYFRGQNIPQIAADRNVNKSTVFRTLRRAEEKLRKFFKY